MVAILYLLNVLDKTHVHEHHGPNNLLDINSHVNQLEYSVKRDCQCILDFISVNKQISNAEPIIRRRLCNSGRFK